MSFDESCRNPKLKLSSKTDSGEEYAVEIDKNRKINEIKNYCIVGVSNIYEEKRAQNELSARIETVVKGFTTAKIKTELLEIILITKKIFLCLQ